MNNSTIQSVYPYPTISTGLHGLQQSSPPLLQMLQQLPMSQQQLMVTIQRPNQSLQQPLHHPPQIQILPEQFQKMNPPSPELNIQQTHRPPQIQIQDQLQKQQYQRNQLPQQPHADAKNSRPSNQQPQQQSQNSPDQLQQSRQQAQIQAQSEQQARMLQVPLSQSPKDQQMHPPPPQKLQEQIQQQQLQIQQQQQPNKYPVPQLQLQPPQVSEKQPPLLPEPVYVSNAKHLLIDELVSILTQATPNNIDEYSKHIFEIITLINNNNFENNEQFVKVSDKYNELIEQLNRFVNEEDPINSKVYLVVQTNFDLFIKIITNHKKVDLATKTIRFLTNLLMKCNYWEIYNLLQWKAAIYHFLLLIQFDLHECYAKFIHDYNNFNYQKSIQPKALPRKQKSRFSKRARSATRVTRRGRKSRSSEPGDDDDLIDEDDDIEDEESEDEDMDDEDDSLDGSGDYSLNPDGTDYDRFVEQGLSGAGSKGKRRSRGKSDSHRVIKKTTTSRLSNKSSNYDPDVVHECQLPSADEPHKLCLRRFSRKYELIRHQETVHSKKKKLFKCFVCVKQNPGVGPRIFTRHDTLAKHIRVNHKISGKEAKAEVAYSKKNAEVVEEGDITVHVGRRKTKVDFELRAHMEKRKGSRGEDLDDDDDEEDMYSDMDSGDEVVTFNVRK